MIEDIKNKIARIQLIWDNYIVIYKECNDKINYTKEVETNYIADLFAYFIDTLDVIFDRKKCNSFSDNFSNSISLLQAIYIQQDLIKELIYILKIKKQDNFFKSSDYVINRDLRNELVGHPISKNRKNKLISTTLFSFHTTSSEIIYGRYHLDKNFEYERIIQSISEIQLRHFNFLVNTFDMIFDKLKDILKFFLSEIDKLKGQIDINDIDTSLKYIEKKYESFWDYKYGYDKITILKIYNKKIIHLRYQNFVNEFFEDLNMSLDETIIDIVQIINDDDLLINNITNDKIPSINIQFFDFSKTKFEFNNDNVNYNYEIGKLGNPKSLEMFVFYSNLLKSICQDKIVLDELDHMEKHFIDPSEYYPSYRLICKHLNVN